ncbi:MULTISPECIES: Sec-independent protein translocase protein TatB [unclassified Acinetobacter]|uniref:Sec-independent protein translocase protein TatB n=1 Tax=unclassified Acinetobacter TaxID=196816 RepID=UPI0015D32E21|nr:MULTISPECIES: Sec-independent protein translocase protein TatB [unclassified Acinetobacter]UUS58082.1 Sec-independent protein translocase protein TatB [Acinetobacter sp. YH16040_T]
MLNIGISELLVFSIIALIVLGPEKLPEGIRFAGKWYGKVKRLISNVQTDIDRELRMSELREEMQKEMQRIQHLEARMQAQMNELQQTQHPIEQTAQKQQEAVLPDNKNLSPRYQYIERGQSTIFAVVTPQMKIKHEIKTDQAPILSSTDVLAEYQVAV